MLSRITDILVTHDILISEPSVAEVVRNYGLGLLVNT